MHAVGTSLHFYLHRIALRRHIARRSRVTTAITENRGRQRASSSSAAAVAVALGEQAGKATGQNKLVCSPNSQSVGECSKTAAAAPNMNETKRTNQTNNSTNNERWQQQQQQLKRIAIIGPSV